jgi:hypothetical protein
VTQVVPRCKLYSKARESDITFDVVVKSYSAFDPRNPMLVWIWECKNYTSEVPVDDVEEFHSKMVQVGAHKGTMVTRVGFQTGALNFAKSHGIGLMTLNKRELIVLAMSAAPAEVPPEIFSDYCMYTSGLVAEGPALYLTIGYELERLGVIRRGGL